MRDRPNRATIFAQALKALGEGDVDAAARIAESLRRSAPQDASVRQLLATVALQRSEPVEAERWALSSLDARPDHSATLVLAARAARALGNLPVALDRFRRAAELDPARADAAFGVAATAIALRPETAPEAIADLSSRFADHAAGWVEIGALLERSARWDLAARAFGTATRTQPSATLCIRLGSVLQALGRRGEAAALYRQALERKPASHEAWFKLGLVLQDSRHPEAAAEAYRRALSLRPDLAEAEANLGVALQEMGDLASAKQAYALTKFIEWLKKYAPPEASGMDFLEAGAVVGQGHIAQQFFWYSAFTHASTVPSLPVMNADGTPKWRMAPGPHGAYWKEGMKLWTPTGVNVPDYPRMAQVWWQNVSKAISGEETPQEAMNDLARDMDSIIERLKKSGVQGDRGPKLNEPKDPEYWYEQAIKDGIPLRSASSRMRSLRASPSITTNCSRPGRPRLPISRRSDARDGAARSAGSVVGSAQSVCRSRWRLSAPSRGRSAATKCTGLWAGWA